MKGIIGKLYFIFFLVLFAGIIAPLVAINDESFSIASGYRSPVFHESENPEATEVVVPVIGNSAYDDIYRFGATFYNGIDYSDIYNYQYYISKNEDIWQAFGNDDFAALEHFATCGIKEGRIAKNDYDYSEYFFLKEIANRRDSAKATYMGVDYSSVYNYDYYMWKNRDVASAVKFSPDEALSHFLILGIYEGRDAKFGVSKEEIQAAKENLGKVGAVQVEMQAKANEQDSPTDFLILANKKEKVVQIYQGEKGHYYNVRSIPCAIGASRSPTPSGTYYVGGKGLYFNTGTRGRCWYYTQIKGNYLFHSQIYDRQSKPVHLIDAAMSKEVSHGCVRLYLDDAKWIYDNVPKGSKIIVY